MRGVRDPVRGDSDGVLVGETRPRPRAPWPMMVLALLGAGIVGLSVDPTSARSVIEAAVGAATMVVGAMNFGRLYTLEEAYEEGQREEFR